MDHTSKSTDGAETGDNKSVSSRFFELAKFLSTVRGDLANITAPPFFLAPSSVVENPHCWAQRPSVFNAPAAEPDAKKRSLLVLRMFLVGLRNQLYVAGAPNVSIKKPLNAFLGELFLASWTDPSTKATTKLVAEQVSHHPPITAMHIAGDHVRADGYARVEMTFSGTVNIRQIGHTVIHIDNYSEDYLLPLPGVQVRGFLSACLYPEITGTYSIISSTGLVSEITFSGTELFRRKKKNYFEARIYDKNDPKQSSIYTISGVWSEGWEVKDSKTGKVIEKYDVDSPENNPAPMEIAPLDDQDEWESRKAWKDVISRLEKGEYRAAGAAKHKVEEAQRKLRTEEKSRGEDWKPLFFKSIAGADHEVFHNLTKGTECSLADSDTRGVWRIDEERLRNFQKPFRGEFTPLG